MIFGVLEGLEGDSAVCTVTVLGMILICNVSIFSNALTIASYVCMCVCVCLCVCVCVCVFFLIRFIARPITVVILQACYY